MSNLQFPTSTDIYIEVENKKVAVVQSYKLKSQKQLRPVEAFGEEEPIGHTRGKKYYLIELSRVYATDAAIKDGIDFHELEHFKLVIVKPDHKIIFTGCEWVEIGEEANLNEAVAENVTLSSTRRKIEKL